MKIDDEAVLELHNKGLSDRQIARIMKADKSTIHFHRCKLGLIANHTNFSGKKNSIKRNFAYYQKCMKKYEIFRRTPKGREWQRRYNREYRLRHKEKISQYNRKYYLRHKERILQHAIKA